MPTVVLGSNIFEIVPTVQAAGSSGGDQLTVSAGNTIPAIQGGAGAPSGASTYGVGSIYVDTTNSVLYLNTVGTTWVAFNALTATTAATSTIATSATNANFFPVFVSATSGNLALFADAAFAFNPSTNVMTLGGQLTLATGAAALTPMVMTSGTLNTTAVAGGVEFNGNVLYFSAIASNRSIVDTPYYFRLNTAVTPTNVTTAQSWLGLTTGVTLQGSTQYAFEGEFVLSFTGAAPASHSESLLFTLTTLTLNNIYVTYERMISASGAATYTIQNVAVATSTTMATAQAAAQAAIFRVKGTLSVNAGGSLRPDIIFSAAPGGTRSILVGSYFRIWPIGASGANISVGTWA